MIFYLIIATIDILKNHPLYMALPSANQTVNNERIGRDLLKVLILVIIFVGVLVSIKYFDDRNGFLTGLAERFVKI